MKQPEIKGLVHEVGWWGLAVGTARALPRVLRAIARARRMSAPWPFFEYAGLLDQPLAASRLRYNIRPV